MRSSARGQSREEALSLLKSGKLDEAIPALENALLAHPTDPQIHSCLGMAYSQVGDIEKSIAAFGKSLELLKSARAYFNLGVAYESAGMTSEAHEQYRLAVAFDSKYAPAQEALNKLQAKMRAASHNTDVIGATPDFSTLAAPKAPPDLNAEKARKELEWQERRRDYVKAGLIYGVICGAIFLFLVRLASTLVAAPAFMMLGQGGSLAMVLVGAIIRGGLIGGIVGLWVGLTCGAENEGAVAGAVAGAAYGLLTGLLQGMGGLAFWNMVISALGTGIFGFFIGKMVSSSLN
ncbi:MAG: tetratricopeptide repeat protein [Armatimonadota bacterium]